MKITKEQLKELVKEVILEQSVMAPEGMKTVQTTVTFDVIWTVNENADEQELLDISRSLVGYTLQGIELDPDESFDVEIKDAKVLSIM